jgi:23S rRNA (guanosine2251-2'-O)-methyltransferase
MGNSNPGLDREDDTLVVGRNAVVELLKGSRQVECIYTAMIIRRKGSRSRVLLQWRRTPAYR